MPPKLLYLITEDWFFKSHFKERAIASANAGFEVYVATKITNSTQHDFPSAINFIHIDFRRSGINPLSDFLTFIQILRVFRRVLPDVIHQVAIKPIIYGTIAARFLRLKSKIVNAPVGMGYVFTSTDTRAVFLKPIISCLLRLTLNPPNSSVIYENPDDLAEAVESNVVRAEHTVLIQGAGVNTDTFFPIKNVNDTPVITLVARMLIDKGVCEFIEAAKIINRNGVIAFFHLVGDPDPLNPASLDEKYLQSVSGAYGISWRGFSHDVCEIYNHSDIACLPSYREGLPKALIEAAACGLPIVTTDTNGCREVVIPGVNGFLVPIKSVLGLVSTLNHLIGDSDLRAKMGLESRRLAVEKFSVNIIVSETLQVYFKDLLVCQ